MKKDMSKLSVTAEVPNIRYKILRFIFSVCVVKLNSYVYKAEPKGEFVLYEKIRLSYCRKRTFWSRLCT